MVALKSKPWITAEFVLLFVLLPAFLAVAMPPRVLFGVLWIMAIYAMCVTRSMAPEKGRVPHDWHLPEAKRWANWKPLLKRYALACIGLVGLTLLLLPDKFLAFPLERPELWVMVMVLYPLLSVVPQEFIYRSFFFERYAALFKKPSHMVWASAIAFGYGHVVFLNWVAVALCVVGGLVFCEHIPKTPFACAGLRGACDIWLLCLHGWLGLVFLSGWRARGCDCRWRLIAALHP